MKANVVDMPNPYPEVRGGTTLKRSDVNHVLLDSTAYLRKHGIKLPDFCHWTPEYWETLGKQAQRYKEIIRNGLGWDMTDFGYDRFPEYGLVLVTLRNGNPLQAGGKKYCEKLMLVSGITPLHTHDTKIEDIICVGGGELQLTLYNATLLAMERIEDGLTTGMELSSEPFTVSRDGVIYEYHAGAQVVLEPGQSITLPPGLFHEFRPSAEDQDVIVREVSGVNDDRKGNFPLKPWGRFAGIDEDVAPQRLLCNEYGEKLSWAREMLVGHL